MVKSNEGLLLTYEYLYRKNVGIFRWGDEGGKRRKRRKLRSQKLLLPTKAHRTSATNRTYEPDTMHNLSYGVGVILP